MVTKIEAPRSPASRERLPAAERRVKIIAAAREVFVDSGYAGARTKQIADRAGLTEAYVFRHFASKELMYEAAILDPVLRGFGELATDIDSLAQAQSDPVDFTREVHRRCLSFYLEHAKVVTVALYSDLESGRDFYATALLPTLDRIGKCLTETVGWGKRGLDPVIVRRATLGPLWAIGLDHDLRDEPADIGKIAEGLTALFTTGVREKRIKNESLRIDEMKSSREPRPEPGQGTPIAAPVPVPGRLKRTRLSVEERKSQIIAAAREVFSEQGTNGARTRLIAERAGITEAYFYRLFHSKEEIYHLAVDLPLKALVGRLQKETHELAVREDVSRPDVLLRCHALVLECMIDLAPLFVAALFSGPDERQQFYSDTLYPSLRSALEAVIPDITGFPVKAFELDLFVEAMIGIHLTIALEHLLENKVVDLDRTAREVTEMFAPGVPPGRSHSAAKNAAVAGSGRKDRKKGRAPVR